MVVPPTLIWVAGVELPGEQTPLIMELILELVCLPVYQGFILFLKFTLQYISLFKT